MSPQLALTGCADGRDQCLLMGGEPDIREDIGERPLMPHLRHELDWNAAAQQSPAVSRLCYPSGRKRGRHCAIKRREFITLIGTASRSLGRPYRFIGLF